MGLMMTPCARVAVREAPMPWSRQKGSRSPPCMAARARRTADLLDIFAFFVWASMSSPQGFSWRWHGMSHVIARISYAPRARTAMGARCNSMGVP